MNFGMAWPRVAELLRTPTDSAFLSRAVAVLDYSAQDARAAGEIRAELERKGQRIGEYDTLIAGQAFSRNLIWSPPTPANSRE